MSFDFVNKQCVVTGASAGIGEEFAKQLHELGANVILIARRQDRLQKIVDQLNSIRRGSAQYILADLFKTTAKDGDIFGVEELARQLSEMRVDLLINNAGVGSFGRFEEINFEFESNIIALNIYATTRLAHAVIGNMKKAGGGGYISISSVAGFQPLPYMASYSASKAFNLFHTVALRNELSSFGIRVLTVCPGPTQTEFFGVARVPGKPTAVKRDSVEDVVRESLLAFANNRSIVITGNKSKIMALFSRVFPTTLTTYFCEKLLRSSLSM